jgi:phosphatidylglycerophosphate synthase
VFEVRAGTAGGLAGLGALLAALASTAGLDATGWLAGLSCGIFVSTWVARQARLLTPADLVTLTRAMLACAVAALVVDATVAPLLVLTVAALLLDAVDGAIARRTRTSPFGARFDGEADAFLMMVLSWYVAHALGGWVIAIGAMRYVFGAAGLGVPWLRAQLPPRYWRKVVTATCGIALATAVADLVPRPWMQGALAVALALLAESFGRDVVWLWRRRRTSPAAPADRLPALAGQGAAR